MSINNQLTPKQIEDLLKKYDTVKPFNRSLFLWLTSAIGLLFLYNKNIQQVAKTDDIPKHLLFIGFSLLLAVLVSFVLTPCLTKLWSWIKSNFSSQDNNSFKWFFTICTVLLALQLVFYQNIKNIICFIPVINCVRLPDVIRNVFLVVLTGVIAWLLSLGYNYFLPKKAEKATSMTSAESTSTQKNPAIKHEENELANPQEQPLNKRKKKTSDNQPKTQTPNPKRDQNKKRTSKNR